MRAAEVYYKDTFAGILTEDDSGYTFVYSEDYMLCDGARPVSLTLPMSQKVHTSAVLFPFFDGLIPEGWLLDVALRNTDVSILDRMSLLLLCCRDCIGAVSVVARNKEVGDE